MVERPPRPRQFTLAEVVDLALRNSPATRLSYTQARAAADVYGSTARTLFPDVTAGVASKRSLVRRAARPATRSSARSTDRRSARSTRCSTSAAAPASIDVARQTAVAADLTHNATVENTILLVEGAAFNYLSTRAQRDAQKTARRSRDRRRSTRRTNGIASAWRRSPTCFRRRRRGRRPSCSSRRSKASCTSTRGALAVAMGLPANTPFDIPDVPASDSVHFITQSVDTLIDLAVKNRPELATARAQAAAAQSQIRVARSGYLPALAFTATGANNGSNVSTFSGNSYSLNFGVQCRCSRGFSNQYDVAAAAEQYQSALARAETTKQQIIQQVFTAYYPAHGDRPVRTSRDLLASATQSEAVARERYREGVGSIVDLLIAQSALAAARAQSVDARWQWRTALAQLAHDVGVLNARGDTTFASLTPAPDVRPER